jgi:hypothetical protein
MFRAPSLTQHARQLWAVIAACRCGQVDIAIDGRPEDRLTE